MASRPIYDPLNSFAIPGVGEITAKGLLVIVGPNSSGKTQCLRDIQSTLLGQQRALVVCEAVKKNPLPPIEQLLDALILDGRIRKHVDPQNQEKLMSLMPHEFGGTRGWDEPLGNLRAWYGGAAQSSNIGRGNEFYQRLGPAFTTSLFLDTRLNLAFETQAFDYETQPSSTLLHSLYMNRGIESEVTIELYRTFGVWVFLDTSRLLTMCLRVAESPHPPTLEEKSDPALMKPLRMLNTQGDGIRSYASICLALLLGQHPVCLVDEPEMCLHPPQAYRLGRFLGLHGTRADRTVILATHSSHVLRGIIDETTNVRILRLSRTRTKFYSHLIPPDRLKECIDRPTTRIETVLDGVFSQAVTIVEADTDRLVYNAVWEKLVEANRALSSPVDALRQEIHFVSVGGKSGIAKTCAVYRGLRIPVAVIADLDLIRDDGMLKQILQVLSDPSTAADICQHCKAVIRDIDSLSPTIAPAELKQRLQALCVSDIAWDGKNESRIEQELGSLKNALSRIGRLKNGGLEAYNGSDKIYYQLKTIIEKCRGLGLFMVPVGELEHWVKDIMKDGPGKTNKPEWANKATSQIRMATPTDDDIWLFMRQILQYQRHQADQLSGYSL